MASLAPPVPVPGSGGTLVPAAAAAAPPPPAFDDGRPPLPARLLLWSIAAFVLAFLLWAALARIDTVTRGQGRIIPSLSLQKVAHLEGGIVSEIVAREGQRVAKGDVLVRLDRTAAAADLGRGSAARDASAARLARLAAEARGRAGGFDAGLAAGSPGQIAAERALARQRRAELDAQLSVARARLAQAERSAIEARAGVAASEEAERLAAAELAIIQPLAEKGIEPQAALLRARSALEQARARTAAARAGVGRADAGVSEAANAVRATGEAFRAGAAGELARTRGELAATGETMPALADRLERTEVRAPVAGLIQRVLVNTVGGVVRPGEPLVEIVPGDDRLVIEARIAPSDIAFVHPGQPVTIRLTAYDFALYGSLRGEVERISPDAVLDEARRESFYQVRVATRDALRDSDGRALPIQPGMVAEVDILGRPRTVLSYLLSPLERVRDTALRER
jgi:adhesin transport system membrane fusion protein